MLGPLISATQRDRVVGLVDGRPDRAQVVTGGHAVDGPGLLLRADAHHGRHQDDDLVQQEIFGPVATVQTFTDEADAIAKANAVEQGLAASVWTRDIGRALRNVNAIQCGVVWVNNHMAVGPKGPLGRVQGIRLWQGGRHRRPRGVHPRQAGHPQPVMTSQPNCDGPPAASPAGSGIRRRW